MKKIIFILIACAAFFALTACTPDDNGKPDDSSSLTTTADTPDETSAEHPSDTTNADTSAENPSDTTNTTGPSAELTPPNESGWQCKYVTMPTFDELEVREMTVAQYNGSDVKCNVAVSPLSLEEYKPAEAMDALKQNPLFKSWFFGFEEYECGDVNLYQDIGQQTAYKWQKNIVATKEYNDTSSSFTDLVVQYSGNTENTIGYTGIRAEIYLDNNKVNATTQKRIFNALKAIYGEQYAEVLCYAPVQFETLLFGKTLKNALISFHRDISGRKAIFDLRVDTHISGAFKGYSGNGDYTPLITTPEYFDGIFTGQFGNCDVSKYSEIGALMLSANFADYTGTVPDDDCGYTYRILNCDNGHKVVEFSLRATVGKKEDKIRPLNFDLDYWVATANGDITNMEGNLQCEVGVTDDKAESDWDVMYARARKMMNYLFEEELDVDQNNNILGESIDVSFGFGSSWNQSPFWSLDDIDIYVDTMHIEFSLFPKPCC